MSIKTQTINLDVFHFEIKFHHDFTFTISFWGKREKGSNNNRVRVNMTFNFYWIRHFIKEFEGVSAKAKEKVELWGLFDKEPNQ